MAQEQHRHGDFLVIGCGAAGLLAALKLAPHGRVMLINKGGFKDSNTYYSQGGIAAVMDEEDSVASHVADTLAAGAGLCHEDVVREIVAMGRTIIEQLVAFGTPFDTRDASLDLTREGAHSHRRVAHVQDATGKAIGETLLWIAAAFTLVTGYQYLRAGIVHVNVEETRRAAAVKSAKASRVT